MHFLTYFHICHGRCSRLDKYWHFHNRCRNNQHRTYTYHSCIDRCHCIHWGRSTQHNLCHGTPRGNCIHHCLGMPRAPNTHPDTVDLLNWKKNLKKLKISQSVQSSKTIKNNQKQSSEKWSKRKIPYSSMFLRPILVCNRMSKSIDSWLFPWPVLFRLLTVAWRSPLYDSLMVLTDDFFQTYFASTMLPF